ncbi:MAG TPA: hypothetical protein VFB37_05820 [Steroidobacteraceae bacterium]|nr:hypothetical protein [Steroidobacteraceae bacterium]
MYPPSRPQSIGEVLDAAFRIYRVTLLGCLPFGVLAIVAGQLPNIYLIARHRPLRQFGGGDPWWFVLYGVGVFFSIAFVNVIVLRQGAALRGSLSAKGALAAGVRKAPVTFMAGILLFLAVGACFIPLAVVRPAYVKWGFVLLCVPATYVGVVLSCCIIAVLMGDKGVFASLRYSAHLVRGNWWRVSTIFSVAIAMLAVFYVLLGVLAALLTPLLGIADVAVFAAVSAVMAAVLGAVGTSFYSAIALAMYGDLEARREGTDLQRRIASAPVN